MLTVAEWFSLHFQAISAMSSPAMGSSPPIVIVAIDIDIELISCLLSEISLEKLSGMLGGLPNAPHVRVSLSCLGINLYIFRAGIVCVFYWLIKNQEMHANNALHGVLFLSYVSESRALPERPCDSGTTPRLLSSAVCYGLAPFRNNTDR